MYNVGGHRGLVVIAVDYRARGPLFKPRRGLNKKKGLYNVCHNTRACKCNFVNINLIRSKRAFCRRAKKKLFSQSKAISWVTKNIFSFVPNKSASQLNYFQTHLFRTSFLTCRRHMKWNGVSTPPPSSSHNFYLQIWNISLRLNFLNLLFC